MKYATEIDFSFNNTMTIFIDNIKENSVVLEFGPASGRLTRYLKNEKNCKVYIVELDEEAGLIAAKDAEDYVIGDIQDYEWTKKFSGIKFDYILFADVLEHLTQAEKVVKAAAKMLKDGGKMCISVPNIAHNSVIINLLKNRFEYTSTGIMDNTHVHFYTKESLDEFVDKCGLYIDKRYATYTQVGKNEFKNSYDDVASMIAEMLKKRKYGEVYQYVYVISNIKPDKTEDYIREYQDYIYAQAFLDYGKNMYEEYKRWEIHADKDKYIFELYDINNAVKLRFDPENCKCGIRLVKAVGIIGDTEEKLEFDSSNAMFNNNDFYYFENDDSQIHFKLSKNHYDKLVIEMEYDVLDALAGDLKNSIVEEQDIAKHEKEKLENKINEQKQMINEQTEDINFRKAFISKPLINTLYKLYCKKNHRDVK